MFEEQCPLISFSSVPSLQGLFVFVLAEIQFLFARKKKKKCSSCDITMKSERLKHWTQLAQAVGKESNMPCSFIVIYPSRNPSLQFFIEKQSQVLNTAVHISWWPRIRSTQKVLLLASYIVWVTEKELGNMKMIWMQIFWSICILTCLGASPFRPSHYYKFIMNLSSTCLCNNAKFSCLR